MEKHRILLLFTALLFGVVSVYAQQTKRIAGVVKDSSGEARDWSERSSERCHNWHNN